MIKELTDFIPFYDNQSYGSFGIIAYDFEPFDAEQAPVLLRGDIRCNTKQDVFRMLRPYHCIIRSTTDDPNLFFESTWLTCEEIAETLNDVASQFDVEVNIGRYDNRVASICGMFSPKQI